MPRKTIGFIGLGRMGYNMVLNLLSKGYKVVVYNRTKEKVDAIRKEGAVGVYSIEELVSSLRKPRIIWIMVKAGKPVDDVINSLLPYLSEGDIVIDGGNSYYQDSIRRYRRLKRKGIRFLDVGVSGGIEGARHGASMMIGGDPDAFKVIEPFVNDMCVENGYAYVGRHGAGHFVKAVHNAIEYGMMASLAEGADVLRKESKRLKIKLHDAFRAYAHGSIIQGRLTSWLYDIFKDNKISRVKGVVPHGETEDEMRTLEHKYNMRMLREAIRMRKETRKRPSFKGKVIALLRKKFGGHSIYRKT